MRHSLGPLLRRATVDVPALASLRAAGGALATPAPPGAEAERLAPTRLRGVPVPRGADGRAGLVAYDGDRGRSGDSITFSTGSRGVSALSEPVNPSDDVLNSTISEPGAAPAARVPAYANTLGHDSGVFDLRAGLRRGGDQLAFRLVSQRDAAWAGVLFVAVGTRKQ